MPRIYLTLASLALAWAVSSCYLPTGNRLCRDLRVASTNCKDHASIRDTFITAFPVGTKAKDLHDSVNRIFLQPDSLTRLHEGEGITELIASYDVKGLAACKERIIVSFALADDAVRDVTVTGGQTCL
jgi:hypothetical protein